MGRHLNRAIQYFGTDTRGLLDGGHYSMLHTRTLEFDELRPYVPGDEIRDIDWRASARAGDILVKRFVTEKHHRIMLVCDTGRDMSGLAPSGEVKRDVAAIMLGAIGLIGMRRNDEIGLVYGDSRGSATVPTRRGENHIEGLIDQYYRTGADQLSDIATQLDYLAHTHRRRLLVVVVADEPDQTSRLDEVVGRLTGRHDLLWLAVSDMPAAGAAVGDAGYDVATGRQVVDDTVLGPRVIAAYWKAEARRSADLDQFFVTRGVPFVRIAGSGEVREKIIELAEVYSRAG
jgi:uncharacterized protein (DUF58 family)